LKTGGAGQFEGLREEFKKKPRPRRTSANRSAPQPGDRGGDEEIHDCLQREFNTLRYQHRRTKSRKAIRFRRRTAVCEVDGGRAESAQTGAGVHKPEDFGTGTRCTAGIEMVKARSGALRRDCQWAAKSSGWFRKSNRDGGGLFLQIENFSHPTQVFEHKLAAAMGGERWKRRGTKRGRDWPAVLDAVRRLQQRRERSVRRLRGPWRAALGQMRCGACEEKEIASRICRSASAAMTKAENCR